MFPEGAHIFPYSMFNKSGNTSQLKLDFWNILRLFWNSSRIKEWEREVFPDSEHSDIGVEACFNLICLNSYAYSIWNKGLFALKPLDRSADNKKLTVQFFWQPQYDHKRGSHVDLLMEPRSSKGLNFIEAKQKTCWLTCLQDDKSPRLIQSGDIFTLTTNDPENQPLPSWEFLKMQWILQRITAMSGAAGTPNVDLNDDDDMSSGFMLIPDDNNTVIRSSFEQVYKWIPPPSVPDMAKPAIKVRREPNPENPESACKRCAKAGRQCVVMALASTTAGGQ